MPFAPADTFRHTPARIHSRRRRVLLVVRRGGVSASMVSITNPGLWFGDKAVTARLARACNDFAARLVADYPNRFGFFAAMPLPDVDATLKALQGIDRPIWLIAGGRDKGGDFSRLTEMVRHRVKHAILIGEAAPVLKAAWAGATTISEAKSLRDAVEWAAREAAAGDVVLMSPACASFDMFRDYQDRGRQFKSAVLALPE